MFMKVFDRVFYRHDMPGPVRINPVDYTGQGRAFPASGRSRDQDHAVLHRRKIDNGLRYIQGSRIRKLESDHAAGRRQSASLVIGVAAETADTGKRE